MPEAAATRLATPLRALVISLDRDRDRYQRVCDMFAPLPQFTLDRVAGVLAGDLPATARLMLAHEDSQKPGTLGVFLAHMKAWEAVAAGTDWTLVLEDDCILRDPAPLFDIDIPAEAELIFVNSRADPWSDDGPRRRPVLRTAFQLLARKADPDTRRRPVGGDGYLLSPEGARKLLQAARADGLGSHVDWRMFRYCLPEAATARRISATWLEDIANLRPKVSQRAVQWGVVRAYCLSPHVVDVGGYRSSRKQSDVRRPAQDAGEGAAGDDAPAATGDPGPVRGGLRTGHVQPSTVKGTRLVGPDDFGPVRAWTPADRLDGVALPYAFDLPGQELLVTLHDDPAAVLADPFLYLAQRALTARVARVPFADLDRLFGAPDPAAQPILVFSIGRTGSTLLDALIGCALDWSVSEPDAITQLCSAGKPFARMPESARDHLIWHSLSPILAMTGRAPCAIKFRSQVNSLAGQVARTFPNARFVFMLRERTSWARSTYRSFRMSADKIVGRLLQGLDGLDALTEAGVNLQVVTYEETIASPEATLARIVGADVAARPGLSQDVARVMAVDSQAGTHLARGRREVASGEEADWLAKFEENWARRRPADLIERLGLDL